MKTVWITRIEIGNIVNFYGKIGRMIHGGKVFETENNDSCLVQIFNEDFSETEEVDEDHEFDYGVDDVCSSLEELELSGFESDSISILLGSDEFISKEARWFIELYPEYEELCQEHEIVFGL